MNAVRVEMLGCGVSIRPDRLTPDTLREAVLTVVGDPSYKRAAQRIARSGTGLGPDHAATVVEDVLSGDRRGTRRSH
jgi:UDP:flavonoid glycosyltransferase YjiC (YdhE family)